MTKQKKSSRCLHSTDANSKKRFRYKFRKYYKNISKKKSKNHPSKNLYNKSTKIVGQQNQKFEKKNTLTNSSIIENQNIFEKIENEYMEKLLNIHYETYSDCYLNNSLKSLNQNKKILTEIILNKFGITEEIRKHVLNYFGLFIEGNKISLKYYFFSVSLFDFFLINYSEANNIEKCRNLFLSKKTKIFCEIKLTLLLFCCYYIIARYYNLNFISINDLLQCKNAKDEFTYDDLDYLIRDILIYTDCNIIILNIYSFVELFMFEIRRIFKKYDCKNYDEFLEIFKDGVSFLGAKLSKKIVMSNIEDSIQALGVMIFGFQLCKEKLKINENIDFYVRKSLFNFQDILNKYYGNNKLPIIIDWLNCNWYK